MQTLEFHFHTYAHIERSQQQKHPKSAQWERGAVIPWTPDVRGEGGARRVLRVGAVPRQGSPGIMESTNDVNTAWRSGGESLSCAPTGWASNQRSRWHALSPISDLVEWNRTSRVGLLVLGFDGGPRVHLLSWVITRIYQHRMHKDSDTRSPNGLWAEN